MDTKQQEMVWINKGLTVSDSTKQRRSEHNYSRRPFRIEEDDDFPCVLKVDPSKI